MIFAIPREEKPYIGTTDTTYEGDIKNPQVNQKDVDYINGLNHMFPKGEIKTTDIVSTWAGLRPLINEKGNHRLKYLERMKYLSQSLAYLLLLAVN